MFGPLDSAGFGPSAPGRPFEPADMYESLDFLEFDEEKGVCALYIRNNHHCPLKSDIVANRFDKLEIAMKKRLK